MADANSSSTNHYLSLTPKLRRESALEMAEEILDHDERMYAVGEALLNRLSPAKGEEVHDIGALRLAEVLTEMMSDRAQHYRLIDCLKVMQREEVRHG